MNLNPKASSLSPSTKSLGFKRRPNHRKQAELTGIFQPHRRTSQRVKKDLHRTVYHNRSIWFSSCSHLHEALKNSWSQSPHNQRLNFSFPSNQILLPALSSLSKLLTGAFPAQVAKCTPSLNTALRLTPEMKVEARQAQCWMKPVFAKLTLCQAWMGLWFN